jgi:hypothetical protein
MGRLPLQPGQPSGELAALLDTLNTDCRLATLNAVCYNCIIGRGGFGHLRLTRSTVVV